MFNKIIEEIKFQIKTFIGRPAMSKEEICEYSKNPKLRDYHDYPDDEAGQPLHFVNMECKRCGANFTI